MFIMSVHWNCVPGSSRGSRPPREVYRQPSLSSKIHSSRRWVMSTSNTIAAFKSVDFDFDNSNPMESTPFCQAHMGQAHKASRCCWMTILEGFVRTPNNNFRDWRTRNQTNSSPETASTNEHQGGSSYIWGARSGRFSGCRGNSRYTCGYALKISTARGESRGLRTGSTRVSLKH